MPELLSCDQRTWIELSKAAFYHNIDMIKRIIGPTVQLGLVIKANAYGHGLHEIALLAEQNTHIEWVFTAGLQEALCLRSLGMTKRIGVLAYCDADSAQAILANIDLPLVQYDDLARLSAAAQKVGRPVRVHLKIEQGLSRLGMRREEYAAVLRDRNSALIEIVGLYSHLPDAYADSLRAQEDFFTICRAIDPDHLFVWHLITSQSLQWYLEGSGTLGDIARIGTLLYGSWKSTEQKQLFAQDGRLPVLIPVMRWKTSILQCRTLAPGDSVGYFRTFRAVKPMRIAILPVGYADGYQRRFSHRASVLIGEQYAPVIGLVSMNVTICDITHIPAAQTGTMVTLIGEHERVRPDFLARCIETNPNEITTAMHPSLVRKIIT